MSIIGIGNALMDVVVKLPGDELLAECNLPKGSMILVDSATSESISRKISSLERVFAPGGSVANTISGLANLGTKAGFIGKVGADSIGKLYHDELQKIGATPSLFQTQTQTGVALALVSPDGERTFGTYLGAAIELSDNDLKPELFDGYQIAYIEGYLVQNHALVRRAAELCKAAGLTIAIDLASFNVVEGNIDFLNEIMENYVDIVFANEDEAKAFTGKSPLDSVSILADICGLAVVKTGKNGSLVKKKGQEVIEIGIFGDRGCVDTTGAGDLYAAGFLHAYQTGKSLDACGKMGALVAGYVVSVYGARMNQELWKEIKKNSSKLLS